MIRSFEGKTPKIHPSVFVSETAYIVGDVEIGEDSCIWPGAVIRGDLGKITLGKNVVVEDNCVIHSGAPTLPPLGDVTIGDNVVFGHGAASNGRNIGNNVLIGMNSTVLHDADIGDYSIIAAGCVVKEKSVIPERSFVAGVPGEVRAKIGDQYVYWSTQSPRIYRDLAERYKKEGL